MIKIIKVTVARPRVLSLEFSDGSAGDYDVGPLIARDTSLIRPLADDAYLARVFLELGALAWPNGFELAPGALHRQLAERGLLRVPPRVA